MTNGAAAAAAISNAIKASGAIVQVEPAEFLKILEKADKPLVVHSPPGFFTKYKYITGYKGLVFFAQCSSPLMLPAKAEVMTAKKIWVPT